MQEFLKKRLGYIKLNFKLLYFILFDSDLKMHGSKKIFFFFLFLCFCVNLDCFGRKTFARNMKSTKINTHIFFFYFKMLNS